LLLSDFNTVAVLNLADTAGDVKGFVGGLTDGNFGYVVPNHSGASYFGRTARFLLSDFITVEVLSLADTDGDFKGFCGGFTDGAHGRVVPSYSGGGGQWAYMSKVTRFLLADFSTVEVLNLADTDGDLKGFNVGFTNGTYGHVVPNHNRKVIPFLLSDFTHRRRAST